MLDTTKLNAAIADLTAQATTNETAEGGATVLIQGFSTQLTAAVTDALTKNDAANQSTIDAATTAIQGVTAGFLASAGPLGAAIAAVPPTGAAAGAAGTGGAPAGAPGPV